MFINAFQSKDPSFLMSATDLYVLQCMYICTNTYKCRYSLYLTIMMCACVGCIHTHTHTHSVTHVPCRRLWHDDERLGVFALLGHCWPQPQPRRGYHSHSVPSVLMLLTRNSVAQCHGEHQRKDAWSETQVCQYHVTTSGSNVKVGCTTTLLLGPSERASLITQICSSDKR